MSWNGNKITHFRYCDDSPVPFSWTKYILSLTLASHSLIPYIHFYSLIYVRTRRTPDYHGTCPVQTLATVAGEWEGSRLQEAVGRRRFKRMPDRNWIRRAVRLALTEQPLAMRRQGLRRRGSKEKIEIARHQYPKSVHQSVRVWATVWQNPIEATLIGSAAW